MSIDEFNLEKYKKINFSSGHLFYLEKFSKNLNTRILLKDDGNYGLGLARGTKVRRFEYFFGSIKDTGVTDIISVGYYFSNQNLILACLCKFMGYRFHVITNLDESFEHGNHNQVLISRMADSITKLNENQWKINTLFVEKLKKKLIKENNGKVEVLQLGAPNLIGSLGLIDLFNEIVCDKSVKSGIDMFFLPVGTGFNLACLYIASHMFNCNKIKFRGISVARNTNQVSLFINKFIHDFNSYFSMSIPTNWNDRITLHDDFIGEGYGRISKSEYSELNSELLNDGFSFDNVYNQKSLFGMIDLLKKEGDLNKETILYLNTGAYTSQLSFT